MLSRPSSTTSSFEILPMYSMLPTRSSSRSSAAPTTRPTSENIMVENRPTSATFGGQQIGSSQRISTPTTAQRPSGKSTTPSPHPTNQVALLRSSGQVARNEPQTPSSIRPSSRNQIVQQPPRTSFSNFNNQRLQLAIGQQLTELENSSITSPALQINSTIANRQQTEAPVPLSSPNNGQKQVVKPSALNLVNSTAANQHQIEAPSRIRSPSQTSNGEIFNPSQMSQTSQTPQDQRNIGAFRPIRPKSQQGQLLPPIAHPQPIHPRSQPPTPALNEQREHVASPLSTHHPLYPSIPLRYVPHPALEPVPEEQLPSSTNSLPPMADSQAANEPHRSYQLPTQTSLFPFYGGQQIPPMMFVNQCGGCSNHFVGPCFAGCCCCRCRGPRPVYTSLYASICYPNMFCHYNDCYDCW